MNRPFRVGILGAILVALFRSGVPAYAQAPADKPVPQQAATSDADLAKQLSNPVASLVSVPLQFNWDQPVGIDDDTRLTMNFQPVVPIGLNEDWNMIVRWIMPYIAQPRLSEEGVPTSGLSDIVASAFFSSAKPGRFIWGVGPVLLLPATSDPVLGSANGAQVRRSSSSSSRARGPTARWPIASGPMPVTTSRAGRYGPTSTPRSFSRLCRTRPRQP